MAKIPVKDNYLALRALALEAGRDDLVAFVDTRIAQTNAKNSKRNTKPTKAQEETEALGKVVLANMSADEAYTISEIQARIPALSTLSNQRVTAIVNALRKQDVIKREVVKGKAYFSLV